MSGTYNKKKILNSICPITRKNGIATKRTMTEQFEMFMKVF